MKSTIKERRISIREDTLWTKTQIAVLAYFNKKKNKPSTYREIARAYVKSNYTDYQRACIQLAKRGYLVKLEDNKFKVTKENLNLVKTGKEAVERPLPYFRTYLNKLKLGKTG